MTLAELFLRLRDKILEHPEITNMPIAIAGADHAGDLAYHEDFSLWIGKDRIVLEGVKKEVK